MNAIESVNIYMDIELVSDSNEIQSREVSGYFTSVGPVEPKKDMLPSRFLRFSVMLSYQPDGKLHYYAPKKQLLCFLVNPESDPGEGWVLMNVPPHGHHLQHTETKVYAKLMPKK